MEMDMIHSAGNALLIILDPIRMAYLFGGVCMGLALGILPGIGGVAGLARQGDLEAGQNFASGVRIGTS